MTDLTAPLGRVGQWLARPAPGRTGLGRWIVFSVVLGIVAGLGAAGLQWAIEFVNDTALAGFGGFAPPGLPTEGGHLSQHYLRHYHWWLLLLVPTLGGFVTGLIVYTFAPEAEGHGTDAIEPRLAGARRPIHRARRRVAARGARASRAASRRRGGPARPRSDLGLGDGVNPIAVRRSGLTLIATGTTRLSAGDYVVLVAARQEAQRVIDAFRGGEEAV